MKAKRLPSTNRATRAERTRPPAGPNRATPAWAAKVSGEPPCSIGTRYRKTALTDDIEQRHRADAEGQGAGQRAPRVAHLARELRRLPPAAEREEGEHERAGERRDEGRSPGPPLRRTGRSGDASPRARGEAPRPRGRRAAAIFATRERRGRSRPRGARRATLAAAIDHDRGERHGLRREAGQRPRRRRRRGPWRAPR